MMWRRVPDHPSYFASEEGHVITLKRRTKVLSPAGNPLYQTVNLDYKTHYLHRIVAQTFISNPDNKPSVNHKDGDKDNNRASNLEWVTVSENMRHRVDVLKIPPWNKGLKTGKGQKEIA